MTIFAIGYLSLVMATAKLEKHSYIYLTSLLMFTLQDLKMTLNSVDYSIQFCRLGSAKPFLLKLQNLGLVGPGPQLELGGGERGLYLF